MPILKPLQFYSVPLPGVDPSELQGKLIVIEGPDTVGRSTQITRLRAWLEQQGHAVMDTGLARGALAGDGIAKAKEGNTLGPATMTLFYATDFADRLENEIVPALRAGFAAIAEANLAFARTLQDDLGLRLRTGLELDHFVLSATALIKGCALRDRADPLALHGIMRPTGPDGAEQEWTILGVGLEALFDEYFELDPAWRPGP